MDPELEKRARKVRKLYGRLIKDIDRELAQVAHLKGSLARAAELVAELKAIAKKSVH